MSVQTIYTIDPSLKSYPKSLKDYSSKKLLDIPPNLYIEGDPQLLNSDIITIIGSRECDSVFTDTAYFLAKEFAKRGFTILSGMALGCDQKAHEGALDAGGKTIGVLAHGLDTRVFYPKANLPLARRAVETGSLLVTTYQYYTKATKLSFVARDYLQAILGDATIVVAAKRNGGTMYAARETLRLGKPLYSVSYHDLDLNEKYQTSGNKHLRACEGTIDLDFMKDGDQMSQQLDYIANTIRNRKNLNQ